MSPEFLDITQKQDYWADVVRKQTAADVGPVTFCELGSQCNKIRAKVECK